MCMALLTAFFHSIYKLHLSSFVGRDKKWFKRVLVLAEDCTRNKAKWTKRILTACLMHKSLVWSFCAGIFHLWHALMKIKLLPLFSIPFIPSDDREGVNIYRYLSIIMSTCVFTYAFLTPCFKAQFGVISILRVLWTIKILCLLPLPKTPAPITEKIFTISINQPTTQITTQLVKNVTLFSFKTAL